MITYSAPASRTIAALTSPVNAPSRSQWQFWPATAMLLLRAASATACSAVNGGATTISTPVTAFTTERSSFTCTTASCTVLNIFQLPAMSGCRIGRLRAQDPAAGRGELPGLAAPTRASYATLAGARQLRSAASESLALAVSACPAGRHAGQHAAAEELERRAAAGRDVA